MTPKKPKKMVKLKTDKEMIKLFDDYLEIKEKNINIRVLREKSVIDKLITLLVLYKNDLEENTEQKIELPKNFIEPESIKTESKDSVLDSGKIISVEIPKEIPEIIPKVQTSKVIDTTINYEPIPKYCPLCNKRIKHEPVRIAEGCVNQRYYCKNTKCGFERIYITKL